MITLASIHCYPVKSLGGFSLPEARLTDRGLEHDRRWMLVDDNGIFITQREVAAMACLHTAPLAHGFRVTDIRTSEAIDLPWQLDNGEEMAVRVFDDALTAVRANATISAWFTERLGSSMHLVYMPDPAHRNVDPAYAQGITSLSDGFPYLILSQASLDDLNARIRSSGDPAPDLGMERFRPNLVIAGGEAFQEDTWKEIMIGEARFALVKTCGRCVIPTTDQRTGERGKEPTRTLASYRKRGNRVEFGMNAMAVEGATVRVGDPVKVAI
ncbi:MAG: MOSC domain-containing protein [Flavobacteriales bacterium]|nr:MOSC domain-containing protein [Flavobacteriales bacterium]